MKTYETIHEAYLGSLADVYDNPDYTAEPRGQKTREKVNYQFTIKNPVPEAIVTQDAERNKTIVSYTKKECELYDSCINTAEEFGKASKFWLNLANPDGTVNSAYGYLIWKNLSHGNAFEDHYEDDPRFPGGRVLQRATKMRTPWDWAKESLIRDKDSRQALLRFSLPQHQWFGNKDQTCTLHGLFLIRENKLNLSITMRSNDLTLGLVYDLPWFVGLIHLMRDQLLGTYPDLQVGTYTHYVHSLHIYDRDEEKILRMLGRKKDVKIKELKPQFDNCNKGNEASASLPASLRQEIYNGLWDALNVYDCVENKWYPVDAKKALNYSYPCRGPYGERGGHAFRYKNPTIQWETK